MKPKTLTALILAFSTLLVSAACSQKPEPTLQPIALESSQPTESASQSRGVVRASGVIAPTKTAQLGFGVSGRVSQANPRPGESVLPGDLLVALEGQARLEAAVAAAQFELTNAQCALDSLYKDTDLLAAQALKTQHETTRALEDLQNPELQEALAQEAIADAHKAIEVAERRFYNVRSRADDADIEEATATMILAKDKLDDAIEDYEPYENKPETNVTRAAYLSKKAAAQQQYDAAVRRLNALKGTGSQADIAVSEADLAKANAQLIQAKREWERLKEGPDPAEIALLEAQIAAAARDYAIYSEGPDPDEVAIAQARLDHAKAQLAAAEAALDEIILASPFDGTIITIEVVPGEVIVPGQPVITMSDLSDLRVETTDLSERDVDRVSIGQKAVIFIEALDLEAEGTVTGISPRAETLGGDVVYTVTIDLSQKFQDLRWGMSVEVAIETE
jgi:HlyD family secretion protein